MSLDEPIATKPVRARTAAPAAASAWTVIGSDPNLGQAQPVAASLGGRLGIYGGDHTGSSVMGSDDGGVTWRQSAGVWAPPRWPAGAAFAGRFWLMTESTVYASADLQSWSVVLDHAPWGPRSCHSAVALGDRLYLMGGVMETPNPRPRATDVWSTADGVTWELVNAEAFSGRGSMAAGAVGGNLLLMGGSGVQGLLAETLVSADGGQSWTPHPAPWPARFGAYAAIIGDTLYLARGQGASGDLQDVWATQDGVAWTLVDSAGPALSGAAAVSARSRLLVLGGVTPAGQPNPDVYALDPSPAGWQALGDSSVAGRLQNGDLVQLGGTTFALQGDYQMTVAASADGTTWGAVQSNLPYRQLGAAAGHHGRLFQFGGFVRPGIASPDVWSSPDGATWTRAGSWPTLPVTEAAMVSFEDQLWVIGGDQYYDGRHFGLTSNVSASTDGATWGQQSIDQFPRRKAAAAAVFQGGLWVLGGKGDDGPLADAWRMNNDGSVFWTAHDVPWAGRCGHAAFVIGGALYVALGKGAGDVPLTDVWVTTDGDNWRRLDTPGPALSGFGWTVVDGGLLVAGGTTPDGAPNTTVYRFRPPAG